MILAIYRPPSYKINEFLHFLDEKMNSLNNRRCLIIGDINIDLLNKDIACERLKDIFISNDFYLCNLTYSTRYAKNSQSLLDHIALNSEYNDINLDIIENSLSDHAIQILNLTNNKIQNIGKVLAQHKIINRINYNLLINQLNMLINRNNDSFTASELYDSILDAYESSIYCKKIKLNTNSKPWFNNKIYNLIKQRDFYFHRKKKFPNNNYIVNAYNHYNNLTKKSIKEAKKRYFNEKLTNVNNKNIWKTLKLILYNREENVKPTINKIKNNNNEIISKDSDICEYANNYFINIGSKLASKIPTSDNIYHNKLQQTSMIRFPTNELEVKNIIKDLNNNKASGLDNISVKMIKVPINEISALMTMLINKSFETGLVPDRIKIAKVTPVFKNGDKENISNYRPISVLPVLSKIIEKIMNIRLQNFFNDNSLLCSNQYGFRKNSDTETAVLDIISGIQIKLYKNYKCGIISLDLCKAFDTVNHKILLDKLHDLGIRGVTHKWLKNYLSNRFQFVHLNSSKSSLKNINCGVPQGSVLAPTLFLVYINSISDLDLRGSIKLFADDTTIFYSGRDLEIIRQNMTHDLYIIADWLKYNKLSLNFSKSKFMYICKESIQPQPSISLFNSQINYSKCIKFLGLYIDEHLTWNMHITNVKHKISPVVGILCKLKHYVSIKYLKLIYFSFIYSHLQYLTSIWSTACNKELSPLKVLQNKSIKNIYNLPYLEPTINLYKPKQLLDIECIYKFKICCYIFSVINKKKTLEYKFYS